MTTARRMTAVTLSKKKCAHGNTRTEIHLLKRNSTTNLANLGAPEADDRDEIVHAQKQTRKRRTFAQMIQITGATSKMLRMMITNRAKPGMIPKIRMLITSQLPNVVVANEDVDVVVRPRKAPKAAARVRTHASA